MLCFRHVAIVMRRIHNGRLYRLEYSCVLSVAVGIEHLEFIFRSFAPFLWTAGTTSRSPKNYYLKFLYNILLKMCIFITFKFW